MHPSIEPDCPWLPADLAKRVDRIRRAHAESMWRHTFSRATVVDEARRVGGLLSDSDDLAELLDCGLTVIEENTRVAGANT